MFTSNYARLKSLPKELRPVAISVGPPRWYRGDKELRLAPTRPMLKMERPDYDRLFFEILAGLEPAEMYAELGDNAVLLCWETPNVWCHRRAVAEWFESELGIVVPEFGVERCQTLPYEKMPAAPVKVSKLTTAAKKLSDQRLMF